MRKTNDSNSYRHQTAMRLRIMENETLSDGIACMARHQETSTYRDNVRIRKRIQGPTKTVREDRMAIISTSTGPFRKEITSLCAHFLEQYHARRGRKGTNRAELQGDRVGVVILPNREFESWFWKKDVRTGPGARPCRQPPRFVQAVPCLKLGTPSRHLYYQLSSALILNRRLLGRQVSLANASSCNLLERNIHIRC